jgi:hypothetical protein
MKIAIATDNYTRVAGHAGKARHWLLYLLHGHTPQQLLPAPFPSWPWAPWAEPCPDCT